MTELERCDDCGKFEMRYICPPDITPAQALEEMCEVLLEKNKDYTMLLDRPLKMVLRPADEDVGKFIDRKIDKVEPEGPVLYLRVEDGYFFFGRNMLGWRKEAEGLIPKQGLLEREVREYFNKQKAIDDSKKD